MSVQVGESVDFVNGSVLRKTTAGQHQQGSLSASFERERISAESALVSNYPDAQAHTTPLISPDNFPQWFSPPWVIIFYVLMEVFLSATREFFASAAYYEWSGPWWSQLLIRSAIIGTGAYFCVIIGAKWTGAYPDLWTVLNVGFCEMFFSKRHPPLTSAGGILSRLSILGKVLVIILFQWPGSVIGLALYAWSNAMAVGSSTCASNPASALSCYLAPRMVGNLDESVGMRSAFLGCLFISASYFGAWGLQKRMSLWVALVTKSFVHHEEVRKSDHVANQHGGDDSPVGLEDDAEHELMESHPAAAHRDVIHKSEQKYVPWQINDDWSEMAKTVGIAHFAAHLLFSQKIVNGLNFWTWFNTALFTGDFSKAHIFAWPGLAANLVIFVFQLLSFLLSSNAATYRSKVLSNLKAKSS